MDLCAWKYPRNTPRIPLKNMVGARIRRGSTEPPRSTIYDAKKNTNKLAIPPTTST